MSDSEVYLSASDESEPDENILEKKATQIKNRSFTHGTVKVLNAQSEIFSKEIYEMASPKKLPNKISNDINQNFQIENKIDSVDIETNDSHLECLNKSTSQTYQNKDDNKSSKDMYTITDNLQAKDGIIHNGKANLKPSFGGFFSTFKKMTSDATLKFDNILKTVENSMSIPSPETLATDNSVFNNEPSLFPNMDILTSGKKVLENLKFLENLKILTIDALDNTNFNTSHYKEDKVRILPAKVIGATLSDLLKEAADCNSNGISYKIPDMTLMVHLDANPDYVQYQALEMLSKEFAQRYLDIKLVRDVTAIEELFEKNNHDDFKESHFDVHKLHLDLHGLDSSHHGDMNIYQKYQQSSKQFSRAYDVFEMACSLNDLPTMGRAYKNLLENLSDYLVALFVYVHKSIQITVIHGNFTGVDSKTADYPLGPDESAHLSQALWMKYSAIISCIDHTITEFNELIAKTNADELTNLETQGNDEQSITIKKIKSEFETSIEYLKTIKCLIKPIFMLKATEIL